MITPEQLAILTPGDLITYTWIPAKRKRAKHKTAPFVAIAREYTPPKIKIGNSTLVDLYDADDPNLSIGTP